MKLNTAERWMVNNPVRTWMLRRNIARLQSWAPGHPFADVLEIGCGFGSGVLAIDAILKPRRLLAFDLDEAMVAQARRRCAAVNADLLLSVADAEHLPYDDDVVDTVFEFTIFHHIPDWRAAVTEVARVLRPGGLFFFEELTRELHIDLPVVSWISRRTTDHPWETIPSKPEFLGAIQDAGMTIEKAHQTLVPGWFQGVARRT